MNFTLYFVRHGQTDWNAQGRLQGQTDIPINEIGRAQARRNGETLVELVKFPEEFDFVASPLKRPRETMEIIRSELALQPKEYATDKRLMEISFGKFEGMTFSEMSQEMPEEFAHREEDKWLNRPPEGESYADLTARVSEWFCELKRDTICVAHGGVSRALRGIVQQLAPVKIVELDVPQDKVLKVYDKQCTWF